MKKAKDKSKRSPKPAIKSGPSALGRPADASIPPALDREESSRQVRRILDQLFDGNAEAIVKSLADSGELTPEEIARMKEVFRKSKGGKKK